MEAMDKDFWDRKGTGKTSNEDQRNLAIRYGQALSAFKDFHDVSPISISAFEER